MITKEFHGFFPETTAFFRGIRANNNRAWFEPRKQDYIKYALNPARALAYDLSHLMRKIDPKIYTNPAKIISRIYRDIRFSKDKSPYKPRLFFSFKRPGDDWMDAPGFYFEVDHESYGFGMGMYGASARTMRAFRAAVAEKPGEFLRATAFYRKKNCMFMLGGQKYARLPAAPGSVSPDLWRAMYRSKATGTWGVMKNFYLYHEGRAGSVLYSSKLEALMEKGYSQLAPFYNYLWKIKENMF
jgi:uncharacterized protein (TIGR02453 family)